MQNRFRLSEEERRSRRTPLAAAVLCALFILAGVVILNQTSGQMEQEQLKSLENAITRGVMQCYAYEGRYPESLSYLEENYGISYDETKFYIDYRPVAENLLPDITVLPIGGAS